MGASIAEHDDDDSDFSESHEINVTPFIDVGVCNRGAHSLLRCSTGALPAAADMGAVEIARQQPPCGA